MTDRFAALRALPRLPPPVLPVAPAPVKATAPAKAPAAVQAVKKKCKPNDPCSCGSHIKFKKCCMHKAAIAADTKPSAIEQMQKVMQNNKPLADAVRQMANKMGLPSRDL
jgi:hypothetical protein